MGKKLLLLLMFMYSGLVFAGGPYSSSTTNNINNYNDQGSSLSGKTDGAALGFAASQCNHDWGTVSLQVCIGLSTIDIEDGEDNVGKAIGFGFWDGRALYNVMYAEEEGSEGVAAGLNFHF